MRRSAAPVWPSSTGTRLMGGAELWYRNPLQNHDCENMDMPAAVTPSVHVTDMACVGRFGHTITLPQSCGLTPTIAWLYIHMSVTRSDVTPRNAYLWPWGSSAGAPTRMVIVRRKGGPLYGVRHGTCSGGSRPSRIRTAHHIEDYGLEDGFHVQKSHFYMGSRRIAAFGIC